MEKHVANLAADSCVKERWVQLTGEQLSMRLQVGFSGTTVQGCVILLIKIVPNSLE
jgi:hypothetical protein